MQEFPALLGAFPAAFEYLAQYIRERQVLQHVIEAHATGRDLIFR